MSTGTMQTTEDGRVGDVEFAVNRATVPPREPRLVRHESRRRVTAVAIVLPGGKSDSFDRASTRQLSVLRMLPFARALRRRGARHGLAVWRLGYRYRGWNGADASPLQDTRWAVAEARRLFPGVPVVLVGHSMGGRAAVRAGGEDGVAGVVALAPWLPQGEPVAQLAGRRLLVAHGTQDAVTSAALSRTFAERAAAVATVRYVEVTGEGHALLRRWSTWHRLTTDFVLDVLGYAPTGQGRGGSGKNPDVRRM